MPKDRRILTWDQLPPELRSYYKVRDHIHKAFKRGTSLIIVHISDGRREHWRKRGKIWEDVTE